MLTLYRRWEWSIYSLSAKEGRSEGVHGTQPTAGRSQDPDGRGAPVVWRLAGSQTSGVLRMTVDSVLLTGARSSGSLWITVFSVLWSLARTSVGARSSGAWECPVVRARPFVRSLELGSASLLLAVAPSRGRMSVPGRSSGSCSFQSSSSS